MVGVRRRVRSDRSSHGYIPVAVKSHKRLISTISAWALAAWVSLPILRLLGALPLVFWLPGAAALRLSRSTRLREIRADPPGRRVSAALSRPRREGSQTQVSDIAMSTALSAAITIAAGLVLALTTGYLPRVVLATILAVLAVGLNLLADRMSPAVDDHPSSASRMGSFPRLDWWIVPTAITCCLLVGLLGYFSWRLYVTPLPGHTYTVLSLDDQHGQKVIQVINHEATTMNFRLKVSQGSRTIASRSFRLRTGGEFRLVLPDVTASKTEVARLMTEPNNYIYRTLVF